MTADRTSYDSGYKENPRPYRAGHDLPESFSPLMDSPAHHPISHAARWVVVMVALAVCASLARIGATTSAADLRSQPPAQVWSQVWSDLEPAPWNNLQPRPVASEIEPMNLFMMNMPEATVEAVSL